jgi:hypothetical protein
VRWEHLTEEEARLLRAPQQIEALGALALSLFGEWREEALFMILTAYVDESGIGGEDHCTVAGFIGKLGRWNAFNKDWRKLLSKSPGKPGYVHLIEIEKKRPPFQDWTTGDIQAFYSKGIKLAKRHTEFGISVTVSREDHKAYREGCPPGTTPDSAYGLCVLMLIDFVVSFFRDGGEKHKPRVNFIFDQGRHTGAAELIFKEMKTCYDDCGRILGDYSSGSIKDHYGLQIADYFVARARRLEGSPLIKEARIATEGDAQERARTGPAPFFHVGLNEHLWDVFFQEKHNNKRRLRWYKAKAKKAASAN